MQNVRERWRWLLILLGTLLAGPVAAHEFWIQPADPAPAPGSVLRLHLYVGDGLDQGEAYARNPEHLRSFTLWQHGQTAAVQGLPGWEPAGLVQTGRPGLAVAAYASHRNRITLDASVFEAYLAEEGLQEILRLRAQHGLSDEPGREAFRRCAKALIRIGDFGDPIGHDHRVGCDLELMPETNPFALAPGDDLPVRLLYLGNPLAEAKVNLFVQGHPGVHSHALTDTQGRARLPVTRTGFHLIGAVHMIPASDIPGADWESIWVSLTFAIPPQVGDQVRSPPRTAYPASPESEPLHHLVGLPQ